MVVDLLGLKINNCSFDEALEKAQELILNGDGVSQIVTINPEMFEYASKNKNFTEIVNNSELVIPDGIGVKIALNLNNIQSDRIPGIDFAKKLLEFSAVKNFPVAIVGAKEEVITLAVKNLKKELNNLNIVYYHNGYFSDDTEIYNEIKKHNPKLILVAMGSPRQEEFIFKAKKVLSECLMIGIGGSLDVWSGIVKRAPKFFRITGTEWLYRTITQPERFKRIFPTLPLFILKAIKYKFFK